MFLRYARIFKSGFDSHFSHFLIVNYKHVKTLSQYLCLPKMVLLLLFVYALYSKGFSQNSPQVNIDNANWTATDALGRILPSYKETGGVKQGRYVGLFYWLWHGPLRSTANNPNSFNVTKILAGNPTKTDWRMEDYYWNEPENGYYLSADPWVMKRHLILIADAGVDFIFLDFTNSSIYRTELKQLLDTIKTLRKNGVQAPYVVPFLNFGYAEKAVALYKEFYKPGKYDDVWFRWMGKPLLMSPVVKKEEIKDSALRNDMLNYFTWRPTWALFPDTLENNGKWRFMDTHPQRAAIDSEGHVEQYVVSKSLGAPLWDYKGKCSSCGINFTPQFDKYWLAKETGTGIYFNEQWNRADSVAAPVLLVTGWNELKAGAWPTNKELAADKDFNFEGKKMHEGDLYFVDEFNDEFNRDLEPMKGGYTDNFYYQFVARMRQYKGMLPPQKTSAPKTILIDGKFDEWNSVTPVYKDAPGDVQHRDYDGVRPGIHYTNNTGRNDIVESRAARDASHIFFYVKTDSALTSYKGKNWMLLFIDADNNKQTGWEGYDYVVNSELINDTTTTIKKWSNGSWKRVSKIAYHANKTQMEISIPLSLLSADASSLTINFHWADNIQKWNDITEFFTNGDSAPERRFDYHFTTQ